MDNDKVTISYAQLNLIPSYYDCLSQVAAERIYIEMIEPPSLEQVIKHQTGLIAQKGPVYYARANNRVVGWCDIFPQTNPRLKHRGSLGMGLISDFRGQGLGSKLLEATLKQAKVFGLEKIELNVYTSNISAIALYKKFGFVQEGLVKKYRKLENQYFDCMLMGKFLE